MTFDLAALTLVAVVAGMGLIAVQPLLGGLSLLAAAVLFVGVAIVEKLTAIDKHLLAIRSRLDSEQ
jgi:hypothetical protein